MSLNGLDDATVIGAYQGALAEGGGWFLLKYASRDAVDVLARGTGGAPEARAAVAQYAEKSPLYGFLLYRRRKVLIKYTPAGTSRLLQARVAVHFTAVAEKFTPHDITMTITSADELSDAALASACSLHTAAPSSASSNSSRPKLDEITEDAEEGPGNGRGVDIQSLRRPSRPSTAASQKPLPPTPLVDIPTPLRTGPQPPELPVTPLERSRTFEEPKSTPSPATSKPLLEFTPTDPLSSEIRNSMKDYDDLFKNGPDPRLSSQTARPAMSDLYAEIYAQYNKPKVKLGPRPKVSLDAKRPHTSGTGAQNTARPVSSLPANMRMARKTNMEPKRPKSRESSVVPSIAFPAPPPMPAFPTPPAMSAVADLAPKSPSSVKSMTLPGYNSYGQRSNGITPEKQRLMKALELRKKQLKAKQEREEKEAEIAAELVIDDEKVVGKDANSGQTLTVGEPEEWSIERAVEKAAENSFLGPEVTKQQIPTSVALSVLYTEFPRKRTEEIIAPRNFEENRVAPEPRADEASLQANLPTPVKELGSPAHIPTSPEPRTHVRPTKADAPAPADTIPSPMIDSGVAVVTNLSEADDQHSAASGGSPTTAQNQGSSCTPSTRPSSVSEDDNQTSEHSSKPNNCDEATLHKLEMNAMPSRSESSAGSSPTVVPEGSNPATSVESPSPQECPTETPSAEESVRKSKRESMVFKAPSKDGDTLAQRRSKRESALFAPAPESFQTEESLSKQRKRASLTLSISKRRSYAEANDKRRAMGDPIRIQLNGNTSEEHRNSEDYLSDDSFMDELQSAKLEEAKPISVSKSPITPFFPRKPSVSESERSVSRESRVGRLSPEQANGRKLSGVWPPQPNLMDNVAVAKKINVSSGISQRIKALAEKSNKDSSPTVSPLATPDASASLVAQRKSSFFSTPPSLDSPSGKLGNRRSLASFATRSNSTTPDHQSVLQPTSPFQTTEKPESVQVTARIIRGGRPLKPSLAVPNEVTPLELHRSQITIDHQTTPQPPVNTKSPVKTNYFRVEPPSPKPSSSHSKDSQASGVPRSSSEHSWRSFGRRKSESRSGSAARSLSAHSSESEDRSDGRREKKESKTRKLFKRMSSISSMSRKGQGNLSVQEQEHASSTLPSLREPPPAVQVGDLNVQFPDTLLWKRRWVEIDAAGNLVLSLTKSNDQSKALTKRFHLTEFRTPFAPDQDRQELPNSIVLDFIDGRTLQCACQTYAEQVQVLQTFREAHDAWVAYNQAN